MLIFRWLPPVAPLALRWIVPADVCAIVTQPRPLPQLAAVIGTPGATGAAGDGIVASLVTDVPVLAGQPLAINRATGRFVLADALIYARAVVVGLAAETTAAGFVVDATGAGSFDLPDWTAITGAAALLPGQLYFLREGGGLTTVRPTASGSSVAPVAEATSPTSLNLRRSSPILL